MKERPEHDHVTKGTGGGTGAKTGSGDQKTSSMHPKGSVEQILKGDTVPLKSPVRAISEAAHPCGVTDTQRALRGICGGNENKTNTNLP